MASIPNSRAVANAVIEAFAADEVLHLERIASLEEDNGILRGWRRRCDVRAWWVVTCASGLNGLKRDSC